jgi:peptidoglycan/xylan/chitin deacetylase (PgdA/CDA1 family)
MGAPPQPPLPVPATIVSLTFDDGDATQILAGRLLRDHRMLGTFFVNSGPIDDRNPYYMTWPEVLQLQQEGNEVGGHTRDHVNLTDQRVSLAKRLDDVCADRKRLLGLGFDVQSFAYPEGAVDRVAETFPRACGYRSARTAGGVSPDGPQFAEQVPPRDPFATSAVDGPGGANRPVRADEGGRPMRLEDLQRPIVAAAANGGGWVQVVLHRVCASIDPQFKACMTGQNPVDDQTLAFFLNWLQSSAPRGTVVRTVSQALDSGR